MLLFFPLSHITFIQNRTQWEEKKRIWTSWSWPLLSRALLPALSCVQTCLLHLLDMNWEVQDLPLFQSIKLSDLLLSMSQENISVHDVAIRWCHTRALLRIKCIVLAVFSSEILMFCFWLHLLFDIQSVDRGGWNRRLQEEPGVDGWVHGWHVWEVVWQNRWRGLCGGQEESKENHI